MKHIIYTLIISGTLILTGCHNNLPSPDTILNENLSGADFTSTMEAFGPQTKTSLSDQNTIVWSEEDLLTIFQGSNIASMFMVDDKCVGTSNGAFTFLETPGETFVSGMEIPANIAVYPYQDELACTGINIVESGSEPSSYKISNASLPAIQYYAENSFPLDALAMVAVTNSITDHNLKFRNLNGALKLQLYGEYSVKKIKIEGNNGEILAGDIEITAHTGTVPPEITLLDKTSTSVTLNILSYKGAELKSNSCTDFIIALPPVKFEEGFTVTITDTEGVETVIEASAENEIKRSHILKMPPVRLPLIDLDANIVFEDEEVKEACVTAFDTNGDRELSYAEAAAVTDLSLMTIIDETTFNKFDEFQYFTSVTSIPDSCFSYTSLESIILPISVTEINNSAFRSCTSLVSVSLSDELQYIRDGAFARCSSLVSIDIPESVREIGEWAFTQCTSLKSFSIPEGIQEIKEGTFCQCTSMTDIKIPNSVTKIGTDVFWNCHQLAEISLPDSLTELPEYTFGRCRSLKSITIPSSVTEISQSLFQECDALETVILHNNITTIGRYAFYKCPSLKSIDLPESITMLNTDTFKNCENLETVYLRFNFVFKFNFTGCTSLKYMYVPESLVDDYQEIWGNSSGITIAAL